jgi:hypothetical protein
MIKVKIKLGLKYPYKISLMTLLDFNKLWGCQLISADTKKEDAKILIPCNQFKKIFGSNPLVGEYNIPSGMGTFVQSIRVIKIIVE